MTDQELIARLVSGDKTAADALYSRHRTFVENVINSICRGRGSPEELVQDTFTKAFLHAAQFDPAKGEFPAWLFTIARNVTSSSLRTDRTTAKSEGNFDFTAVMDETDRLQASAPLAKDLAAALITEIDKLKAPDREIMTQRLLHRKPFDQIAKLLKKPVDTIKSIFYRQTKLLKAKLRRTGSENDES
jgi:RNA polymerase sigma-70 factor, ECF subfamily